MAAKTAVVLVSVWSAIAPAQDIASNVGELNNQAQALVKVGRFQDAEKMYQSALAVEPGDELSRARVANNLAVLYRMQDRYRDAEQALRSALERRQKSLPAASVEIAYSLNNLADVYRIEGRDWEARNLFETALRKLREFHPGAAGYPVIAGNLAVELCKFGEFDQAETLLRTALSGSERLHGATSLEVGIAANNLGQVLQAKKDYVDATVFYDRALQIFENRMPEAAIDVSIVLANVGQLLAQLHQLDQARQFEERALNLLSVDGHGPLRSAILQKLGNIVVNSGNAADALPYFEQSLSIQEKTLGLEHPSTISILRDYAAATSQAGQKSLAHKLRKQADKLAALLHSQLPVQLTVSVGSLRAAK